MSNATQSKDVKLASTLSQFARINSVEAARRDDIWLTPDRIVVEPGYNVRGAGMDSGEYWEQPEVIAHIERLAQAYARDDSIPPIKGKFDKETQTLRIRDGEHRYRGLNLAISRGAVIPKVRVEEVSGDEINQQIVMLTSSETRPLTPVERAELYHRLYNHGLSYEEIAAKVLVSKQHVKQYIEEVYNLPVEVKRQLALGKITISKALTPPEQIHKARVMKNNKKTVGKVMDVLLKIKDDSVEVVDGQVSLSIPEELWEQIQLMQDFENKPDEVAEEFAKKQCHLELDSQSVVTQ